MSVLISIPPLTGSIFFSFAVLGPDIALHISGIKTWLNSDYDSHRQS